MINFATIGLVAALAIFALVALGYFFGPPLVKRIPPRVRQFLGAAGHVLLLLLWGAQLYQTLTRHPDSITWWVVAIIGAIGLIRMLIMTFSNASTGRGTHA